MAPGNTVRQHTACDLNAYFCAAANVQQ